MLAREGWRDIFKGESNDTRIKKRGGLSLLCAMLLQTLRWALPKIFKVAGWLGGAVTVFPGRRSERKETLRGGLTRGVRGEEEKRRIGRQPRQARTFRRDIPIQ